MTQDERAVIQLECARLINLYAHLTDAGDYEALAALYTEDGVFARPTAPDAPIQGPAAILAAYRERPPRLARHIVCNVVVTPEGPDRARGASYLLLYTAAAGQEGLPKADAKMLIGAFDDLFVREGGAWKFAERRGSLALQVGG